MPTAREKRFSEAPKVVQRPQHHTKQGSKFWIDLSNNQIKMSDASVTATAATVAAQQAEEKLLQVGLVGNAKTNFGKLARERAVVGQIFGMDALSS